MVTVQHTADACSSQRATAKCQCTSAISECICFITAPFADTLCVIAAGGMVEFRRSLAASFLFRFVVHANYALAVRCSHQQGLLSPAATCRVALLCLTFRMQGLLGL